ncbi:MAG: hypothetical protein INQ03_26005 [Candidatus Heimdallarchaeota archaeon]|nr:hypothetical protein [Candidatus Heimdallarchaeota archaeon]
MSDNIISLLLNRLVKVFNDLDINYAFVGGVAVIAFGRIRTTSDIDVIIDHRNLNREKFVHSLRDTGFDITLRDLDNFDEKMHVNFFDTNTMFRIDMKGIYKEKDEETIREGKIVNFVDLQIKLDSFENIIVNKLLFGSQIDIEDAMAILTRNFNNIDFELLKQKSVKLGVSSQLQNLLELFDNEQ